VSHLPALWISKKYSIPWFITWNDIEPATNAPIPYGKGLHAKVGGLDKSFFRQIILKSTHNIFPSEESCHYMSEIYPELKNRSTVIPHVASHLHDIEINPSVPFTIAHAGSFDGRRNPDTFFEAIRMVNKLISKTIHVKLIGNHISDFRVIGIPEDIRDQFQLIPWQTYSKTIEFLQHAHVLLLIEAPMEEGIYLPGKFVDYVQCRRPVLAISPERGVIQKALSTFGGGLRVDYRSPGKIADAIVRLHDSWKEGNLATEFCTQKLYEQYCEEKVMKLYGDLMDRFCNKRDRS